VTEFSGQTIVVIGGCGEIGSATAAAFVAAGGEVVRMDVHPDAEQHVDLTDAVSVDAAFRNLPALHVLVNAAGISHGVASEELDIADWDRVLAVNLRGSMLTCQAAGRRMLESGGGAIVNIASAAAFQALPRRAAYCASKAGVVAVTKVLAVEWARRGIRVNAVAPGWVHTKMVQASIDAGRFTEAEIDALIPMGRLASVDEVADAILFLASDRARYVTGETLFLDGGFAHAGQVQR
jgi:NAD(P)-dependent dehydrogenase (short-subunit alcohol dehydrogenase family)